MSPLLQDPWFLAMVDGVIARHGRCVTTRQVETFRRQLAHTFETHPVARASLAAVRPDLVRRLAERAPN